MRSFSVSKLKRDSFGDITLTKAYFVKYLKMNVYKNSYYLLLKKICESMVINVISLRFLPRQFSSDESREGLMSVNLTLGGLTYFPSPNWTLTLLVVKIDQYKVM